MKDLAYGPYGERNLLDLYLPDAATGPTPLVVVIHGGGWQGGGRDSLRWVAERLAGEGMAAAAITYRFWPQWRCPAAIEDAGRAVRWLRRHAGQYGLDPQRVAAMGSSAGAHLGSYLALAETPDSEAATPADVSSRVCAMVDCCGPVDFPAMMSSASAPIVEGFMGQPFGEETAAAYRAASPYYLVAPQAPPLLILHGTEDLGVERGQVPLTVAERFAERLRSAGGEVTLVRLEGAGHGFINEPDTPNGKIVWDRMLAFFSKHFSA